MTLLLKGAILMTLRELIHFLRLYIPYPDKLGNIEIRNEADYCRYQFVKYFLSQDFQKDMHTAEIVFSKQSTSKVKFYFLFHRDSVSGNFSLSLEYE